MSKKVDQGVMNRDIKNPMTLKNQSRASGLSAFALGFAQVVSVNYEEHFVTLRLLVGEDQEYQKFPVPITYPYAGKRSFMGMMPSEGDYCVVGFMPQNTGLKGGSKIPVVLTWIPQGVWVGQDWLTSQEFPPTELGHTQKDKNFIRGAFYRTRNKLRHLEPGNALLSSEQGSDLFLDRGVLLTNRRANELRLRDQDQALIVRTLQQYHAMSGTRIYGGSVHREGFFLPSQMFSDGRFWDQYDQVVDGNVVHEKDLQANRFPNGFLTPGKIFQRSPANGNVSRPSGPPVSENLDPYKFLQRGLFIDSSGYIQDSEKTLAGGVYGGKSLFRVSAPQNQEVKNASIENENSLTEYRIEVSHTANGTLPVTEQTDLFDADRLPKNNPNFSDEEASSVNAPFIEQVMGSVVGNNPFSQQERELYGLPVQPTIFDQQGNPNSQLVSALEDPIAQHSATLFRLRPINNNPDTFVSFLKNGELRFSISGTPLRNSVEGSFRSNVKLFSGGSFQLDTQQRQFYLARTQNLDFETRTGSITFQSSLNFDAQVKDNITLNAGQNIAARGSSILLSGNEVNAQGLTSVQIQAGDQLTVQSKTLQTNVVGKVLENFGGPRDNDPSAAPIRETVVTSSIAGLTGDSYTLTSANRVENITNGNHTTTITIGNLTYETTSGTYIARSGTNELQINNSSGMTGTVTTGDISLTAQAGTSELNASGNATVRSTGGSARLSGQGTAFLGSGVVGSKIGNIVSSADIDPISGLTLGALGQGSPGHQIGLPV